tara:strand:- start:2269 stop:2379 length:111 start_codon:yes stop_codon:yes gene_type:complete
MIETTTLFVAFASGFSVAVMLMLAVGLLVAGVSKSK